MKEKRMAVLFERESQKNRTRRNRGREDTHTKNDGVVESTGNTTTEEIAERFQDHNLIGPCHGPPSPQITLTKSERHSCVSDSHCIGGSTTQLSNYKLLQPWDESRDSRVGFAWEESSHKEKLATLCRDTKRVRESKWRGSAQTLLVWED